MQLYDTFDWLCGAFASSILPVLLVGGLVATSGFKAFFLILYPRRLGLSSALSTTEPSFGSSSSLYSSLSSASELCLRFAARANLVDTRSDWAGFSFCAFFTSSDTFLLVASAALTLLHFIQKYGFSSCRNVTGSEPAASMAV